MYLKLCTASLSDFWLLDEVLLIEGVYDIQTNKTERAFWEFVSCCYGDSHIPGDFLCSPKAYTKPSLPPINSMLLAMHGDESIMSMVGNSHVLLPFLMSRPYMWESREPKNSVSSFIDMAGEDHILSPVMNSHAFSPVLQSIQYTFPSDAAKKYLVL